ncbi:MULTISPECIES: hypothetical protein [Caulobacter]|jgi:hypothetical protein|uniref:Uncharacterized protein n=1 Tax=Caulobacter vibrioides OR37 TaxID=1292034 RepID=R0E7Z6_CAUVI|nr:MULTISPECIES: hypothetical protein [Caulobacter]ENZ81613.1 hypothetical protein OR37_02551 [Caulobacter vibrioides OR37]PIB96948.1 hypothetical protein CSW60_20925 [Caulobacter sp. X]
MSDDETFELSAEDRVHINRVLDLAEAWESPEPVVVDGVCFHLTCDVDKEVWKPLHTLGTYGQRQSMYGPELIFPWTPPWIRDFMSKTVDVIDVEPGSLVVISVVGTAQLKSPFAQFGDDDAHKGKQARIVVLHADKTVSEATRPLVLLTEEATDAFVFVEDYSSAYQALLARLGVRAEIEDINELVDEPLEAWPVPSPDLSETYKRAILALVEGNSSYDPAPYAVFGYLMARAEAEERLLAPAVRGLQADEQQARFKAGKRQKSRSATEKLRLIAKAIIAQNSQISLSRCARMVEEQIRNDPKWTFTSDDKWIARHIRELFEKRGDSKEYQPRRDLRVGTTPG